jgi:hypothetical protein
LSDHRGYAQSCRDGILQMQVPRLKKDTAKHITPRLSNFVQAFLRDVLNCGLNTTPAAESMNRLLKVDMRIKLSMDETRDWFPTRLRQNRTHLESQRLQRQSVPINLEA